MMFVRATQLLCMLRPTYGTYLIILFVSELRKVMSWWSWWITSCSSHAVSYEGQLKQVIKRAVKESWSRPAYETKHGRGNLVRWLCHCTVWLIEDSDPSTSSDLATSSDSTQWCEILSSKGPAANHPNLPSFVVRVQILRWLHTLSMI